MDKPDSREECIYRIKSAMPPPDHKHGYYKKTAEEFAAKWNISPQKLWREFKVPPIVKERASGEIIYFTEDVARAIRGAIDKTWVDIEEWD